MTSTNTKSQTIVLIPGLWMTALSWEHWIERYVARGHHVIAKSWPGMDGDIEQLRRDPSGTSPSRRSSLDTPSAARSPKLSWTTGSVQLGWPSIRRR
jgi:hypothetical protein